MRRIDYLVAYSTTEAPPSWDTAELVTASTGNEAVRKFRRDCQGASWVQAKIGGAGPIVAEWKDREFFREFNRLAQLRRRA